MITWSELKRAAQQAGWGATRGGAHFVASVPDRRGGPVRNMDTGPDAPDRLRAGIDA